MLSEKQKKLVETIERAWSKRPGMRLITLLDEASARYGTGDVILTDDDSLEVALRDYVGLPRK